jgi:hypothetical protein
MSLVFEERLSDSPYVETITHGHTVSEGTTIRPAEANWHMVIVKYMGQVFPILTGPLNSSGVVRWTAGAEILWVRFKLGTFMPHLPTKTLIDQEKPLPNGTDQSFWLNGSTWELPDFENVDTFINRLVRQEVVVHDPMVNAVLQGEPQPVASRTIRHRFLHATGLTQTRIYQIERAKRAASLLRHGVSILDVVDEAGYFDQPHLTRALRQWIGHTPAQIVQQYNEERCKNLSEKNETNLAQLATHD